MSRRYLQPRSKPRNTRESGTVPPMEWSDHISVDSTVCHGKVCIKGTRVLVSIILGNLFGGVIARFRFQPEGRCQPHAQPEPPSGSRSAALRRRV